VKVNRAREHLVLLRSELSEFASRLPYVIEDGIESPSGDRVLRVRFRERIDPRWAAIVGDVVHNLRSALDLLAWQLVLSNGGTPDQNTAFPVAENAEKAAGTIQRRLRGASQSAIRLTSLLRPYETGNQTLWPLHKLDIEDKHHLLVPVVVAQRGMSFDLVSPPGSFEIASAFIPQETFPVHDGDEVARFGELARQIRFDEPQFHFDLAIGIAHAEGHSILQVLERLHICVEQTLITFERRFFPQSVKLDRPRGSTS
jgi:hypothetical protein